MVTLANQNIILLIKYENWFNDIFNVTMLQNECINLGTNRFWLKMKFFI